jgi:hypothetical protein
MSHLIHSGRYSVVSVNSSLNCNSILLGYSNTCLQWHKIFIPFHYVVTEFNCIQNGKVYIITLGRSLVTNACCILWCQVEEIKYQKRRVTMHIFNPLQTANTMLSSSLRFGHRIKKSLTKELRHDAKYHKWLVRFTVLMWSMLTNWNGEETFQINDLSSEKMGGGTQYREQRSIKP